MAAELMDRRSWTITEGRKPGEWFVSAWRENGFRVYVIVDTAAPADRDEKTGAALASIAGKVLPLPDDEFDEWCANNRDKIRRAFASLLTQAAPHKN